MLEQNSPYEELLIRDCTRLQEERNILLKALEAIGSFTPENYPGCTIKDIAYDAIGAWMFKYHHRKNHRL